MGLENADYQPVLKDRGQPKFRKSSISNEQIYKMTTKELYFCILSTERIKENLLQSAPKKSKSLFLGAKEAIKEFGKNLTTSRERRVRQRSEKKRAAGGGGALTIPRRVSTCVDTRREPSDSEMELDEQGYASDAGVAMDVEHSSHSEEEEEQYHGPPGYPALMPTPIQYSTPVYGDPMMETGSSHGFGAEYMGMGQPGSSQYGYMPPHQPNPVWEQPHTPIYEPQNQWQGTRGWEQAAASNMTEEQMRERNLAYVPYMNEAAAGGPDDPEFFRSWPGHVSYHIYQGKRLLTKAKVVVPYQK